MHTFASVALTPEIQALISALVTFLVVAGLKSLGDALNIDLSPLASGLIATAVAAIIFFANSLLAQLPAGSEPLAVALMGLIVAILSAFGIHGTLKSLRPN